MNAESKAMTATTMADRSQRPRATTRSGRVRRRRHTLLGMAVSLVAAALVVVMPSLPGLPSAPAAQAYNGGASNSSPAAQPCTEPCSFVADNTGGGLTSFPYGGYQNYWSTWWSFTPLYTRTYTFRANSTNPVGWDNTLTLTDTSGNVVAHNDDSYGLDAMISPSLTAGVTYRLGMGGYHSGSQGVANITISSSPPERPVTTGGSATAGDRSASVSWTAPFDNYAAITQYRVYCNGGASACATVSGTPPATSTTVTGLTNGVSYTFEIAAVNANGEGPRSSATNAVVPSGPTSTSVAASPGSPIYPNSFSVTATVSGTSAINVGTVEFFRGGVSQGTASVTSGTATLSGQSLAPGTYSYRADYSGGSGWGSSSGSASITVGKGSQTITFTDPGSRTWSSTPFSVAPTASSGLAVAVSSTTPSICTVSNNQVTTVTGGQCTLVASQSGDTNWNAASNVSRTFNVTNAPQTITFADPADRTWSASTFTLSPTSSSGLSATLTSNSTDVCTVSGTTVTMVKAGTCELSAVQAGNTYFAAATPVVQSFEIARAPQALFTASVSPTNRPPSTTSTLSTSGGSGTGAITYAVTSGAEFCSIEGSTLTADAEGSCVVTATKAGDDRYLPASATTAEVTIAQVTPSVEVTGAPTVIPGQTRTVTVTVSGLVPGATAPSVAPVLSGMTTNASFSPESAVVTLEGDGTTGTATFVVTAGRVGTLVVGAAVTANAPYTTASDPSPLEIEVAKARPAIDVTGPSTAQPGETRLVVVTVTGLVPGVTPSRVSLDLSGASAGASFTPDLANLTLNGDGTEGSTFFWVTAGDLGTLVIDGTLVANASYETISDPTPLEMEVAKQPVTVAVTGAEGARPGETVEVTVTITGLVDGIATTDIVPVLSGTTGSASVTPLSAPITMAENGLSGTATFSVTAGDTGTLSVGASVAENGTYLASSDPTPHDIEVVRAAQSITFDAPATTPHSTGSVEVTPSASSGLAVSLSSTTPDVCSVEGTTVTLLTGGDCSLTASQEGDWSFLPAPDVSRSFAVVEAPQTITFTDPADTAWSATPLALDASSTSGLPVVFSSDSPDVCSVDGDEVTLLAAGTCTITARQAGDEFFAPAEAVSQSLEVALAEQTALEVVVPSAELPLTGSMTLSTTGGSGTGDVSYEVTDGTSVCSISGDTVTGLSVGSCVVTATKAGDARHLPTSASTELITVPLAVPTVDVSGPVGAVPGEQFTVEVTVTDLLDGFAPGTVTPVVSGDSAGSSIEPATAELTVSDDGTSATATFTVTAGTAGELLVGAALDVTPAYAAATDITPWSVDVVRAVPAISVVAPDTALPGETVEVTVTLDGMLPGLVPGDVSLDLTGSLGATADPASRSFVIDGTVATATFQVTAGDVGTLAIGATVAESHTYAAVSTNASTDADVTIARATPTVSVTGASSAIPGQTRTVTVTVDGLTPGLVPGDAEITLSGTTAYASVSPTSAPLDIAVDGRSATATFTVTAGNVGTLTIAASIAESASYTSASDPSPLDISVAKGVAMVDVSGPAVAVPGDVIDVTVTVTELVPGVLPSHVSINLDSLVAGSSFSPDVKALTISPEGDRGTATFQVRVGGAGLLTIDGTLVANPSYRVASDPEPHDVLVARAQPVVDVGGPAAAYPGQVVTATVTVSGLTAGLTPGTVTVDLSGDSTGSAIDPSSGELTLAEDGLSGTFEVAVTAGAEGELTLSASVASTDAYEPASAATPLSITVAKLSQTITFEPGESVAWADGPVTLSPTATSDLTVSVITTTPDICSVDGLDVTLLDGGPCVLVASQAGNSSYLAAPDVERTVIVTGAPQSISFDTPSDRPWSTATFDVAPTSSAGLPVSVASSTPSVCSVEGSTVSLLTSGTCTLVASQAGDEFYGSAAPVEVELTVDPAAQADLVADVSATTVVPGLSVELSTTGGSGDGAVTYAVTSGSEHCSIEGSTLVALGAGTCTVTATKAGDDRYASISADAPLVSVERASFDIDVEGDATAIPGETVTVTVTATGLVPTLVPGDVRPVLSGTTTLASAEPESAAWTVAPDGLSATAEISVTAGDVGTLSIGAEVGTSTSYQATADATPHDITVARGSQSITPDIPAEMAFADGELTLVATSTSGLAVTFTTTTPSLCTIEGTTITPVTGGDCVVVASQAGDWSYLPAADVERTLHITGAPQTITFEEPADRVWSTDTIELSPTSSSGLAVTIESSDPTVCTVEAGTVTLVRAGTCTLVASQDGDDSFVAAEPVERSFTVARAAQATLVAVADAEVELGEMITLSTTSGSGDGDVTWTVTTGAEACSVTEDSLLATDVGTCTATAVKAADDRYDATSAETATITVVATTPTLEIDGPTAAVPGQTIEVVVTVGGVVTGHDPAAVTLAITGTSAGTSVSEPSIVPSVDGDTATATFSVTTGSTGTARFGATLAADSRYNTASTTATHDVSVAKGTPAVDVGGPTSALPGERFPVTVTIAGLVPGLNPAQVSLNLEGATTGASFSPATVQPTVSGDGSGATAEFMVTAGPAGSLVIDASLVANSAYGTVSDPTPLVLPVERGEVTLSIEGADSARPAETVTVTVTVGDLVDGLQPGEITAVLSGAVDGASVAPATAWPVVDPSGRTATATFTVTAGEPGTLTVGADMALDESYLSASTDHAHGIDVALSAQSIEFEPGAVLAFGEPLPVEATATSGLVVALSTTTPEVCSVESDDDGHLVTATTAGTCTLVASQAGDTSWLPAADVERNLQVTDAVQTISFVRPSDRDWSATPFTVTATATSGLPVSFSSATPTICSVDSSEGSGSVTMLAAGECTLLADQAGDDSYAAAAVVERSFTIIGTPQAITFAAIADAPWTDGPMTPSVSSSSGGQVVVTTTTPTVCSVSSGTVQMLTAGRCTLVAHSPGTGHWASAEPVTRSFEVLRATQARLGVAVANTTPRLGATTRLSTTGGSGTGSVTYRVVTGARSCSVSGNQLTSTGIGVCTISATKAADSRYGASTATSSTITVIKGRPTVTVNAGVAMHVGARRTVTVTVTGLLPGHTPGTVRLHLTGSSKGAVLLTTEGRLTLSADRRSGTLTFAVRAGQRGTMTITADIDATRSYVSVTGGMAVKVRTATQTAR